MIIDGFCFRKRQSSPGRERITGLQSEGSGVRAVLDQQSENDRKQDDEEKPSFHGGECDTRFRQVNSGSPVSLFSQKMRRSGRELATGAFEANGNHFDQ
ncbi:hypothetical protein [Bradyrhizobium sp.]|uniref:hypothetical protein n=1 Tax=Bradyrhizobium sp. TaxID=376 RepID=UPI003C1A19B4